MPTIQDKLTQVKSLIQASAQKAGRSSNSVTLLAVSKKQPAKALKAAYDAGQRDFGENYLQEGEQKRTELAEQDICWHFIGPIQSNKTKTISGSWHWVHTVDRTKIIDQLNKYRRDNMPPLNICIQVNIDGDPAKSGCKPDEVLMLAQSIDSKARLKLRGLMTIPAKNKASSAFAELKALFDTINAQRHNPMDTLSMGMSEDLETAIEHGATIVRVGTAIFGPREL